MVIIILGSQLIEQSQQFKQHKLIIYNIPKVSAIDFISSKHNVLLTDSAYMKNESSLLFHIKHNWWDLGLVESEIATSDHISSDLLIRNGLVQFRDKRIAIINKSTSVNLKSVKPLSIDYLVISHDPKIHIKKILKTFSPSKIIFDSSNSKKKVREWKEECHAAGIDHYSVSESGAFVENI
jgi:competence protein ComEC